MTTRLKLPSLTPESGPKTRNVSVRSRLGKLEAVLTALAFSNRRLACARTCTSCENERAGARKATKSRRDDFTFHLQWLDSSFRAQLPLRIRRAITSAETGGAWRALYPHCGRKKSLRLNFW